MPPPSWFPSMQELEDARVRHCARRWAPELEVHACVLEPRSVVVTFDDKSYVGGVGGVGGVGRVGGVSRQL